MWTQHYFSRLPHEAAEACRGVLVPPRPDRAKLCGTVSAAWMSASAGRHGRPRRPRQFEAIPQQNSSLDRANSQAVRGIARLFTTQEASRRHPAAAVGARNDVPNTSLPAAFM